MFDCTQVKQVLRLPVLLVFCFLLLTPRSTFSIDWLKAGESLLQGSSQTENLTLNGLTDDEIAAGIKDALKVGSWRVVSQLRVINGFNADPQIHIPLPQKFEMIRSMLRDLDKESMLDDLELKLNRAAEKATPQAKALFLQAIREMSIDNVRNIYKGPDDAATRYLQKRMSLPLAKAMRPVVSDSLSQVGAIQAYDDVMGEYQALPFAPDINADLTSYVVEKGMDGIFFYLAKEEAAIRQDPGKRTTEILQKVFGGA